MNALITTEAQRQDLQVLCYPCLCACKNISASLCLCGKLIPLQDLQVSLPSLPVTSKHKPSASLCLCGKLISARLRSLASLCLFVITNIVTFLQFQRYRGSNCDYYENLFVSHQRAAGLPCIICIGQHSLHQSAFSLRFQPQARVQRFGAQMVRRKAGRACRR